MYVRFPPATAAIVVIAAHGYSYFTQFFLLVGPYTRNNSFSSVSFYPFSVCFFHPSRGLGAWYDFNRKRVILYTLQRSRYEITEYSRVAARTGKNKKKKNCKKRGKKKWSCLYHVASDVEKKKEEKIYPNHIIIIVVVVIVCRGERACDHHCSRACSTTTTTT